MIQITTNRGQATYARRFSGLGGLHAQILYRCRGADFGHRFLGECSHEQRRAVTRFLQRRARVIGVDYRSRTGVVDARDKMNAPEGANRAGRVQSGITIQRVPPLARSPQTRIA